ncbi:MAG: YIP1 family protein [Dehalococcoidia bacterium]|nr:YIP1 family protein [Dehalococcoidia bacterium]
MVVTSLAAGIGSALDLGIVGLVVITVAGVIGWALYAWITYFIGTRLLAGPETSADWGELARALGSPNSPRILLILGVVPVLAGIVGLVVLVWVLIATVIALRAALDFSTGRAIGTAALGWIVQVAIYAAVYALLAA